MGPVRGQADEVVAMLTDPARCQVLLVTLPEETPVNEVVETAFALEDRVGIALGPVVVNSCLPDRVVRRAAGAIADAALAGVELPADDARRARRGDRRSSARAARSSRSRSRRLAQRLPLPQIRLPFVDRGDRPRRDRPTWPTCSPRRSRGMHRHERPRSTSSRPGRPRRARSTSWCAAAPAAWARPPPPPRSRVEGARRGRRVAVITIDPARRLADTLGLGAADDHEVERALWDPDGNAPATGRLTALMLDTERRRSTASSTRYAETRSSATASSRTASTATSPARCRARRSTWRWSGCTSSTRPATTTSSSSTRRRPATRSTSSTRRNG